MTEFVIIGINRLTIKEFLEMVAYLERTTKYSVNSRYENFECEDSGMWLNSKEYGANAYAERNQCKYSADVVRYGARHFYRTRVKKSWFKDL